VTGFGHGQLEALGSAVRRVQLGEPPQVGGTQADYVNGEHKGRLQWLLGSRLMPVEVCAVDPLGEPLN